MELRHLRYFIGVAEEENVSRAALKLHVSQPALSRQVRDLEDELGFLLLTRSAKSVRLTEAGRAFLTEARAVLLRAEEAVKTAHAIATGARGELHVGYAPSLTARFLPQTLRAFQAISPGVRVKLHDFSTEEMLAGLRDGKLQIAFVVRLPALLRGLRFEDLARDAFRLAVAPKHPLAGRRAVTLAEAAREPLITYSRKDYPDAHETLAAMFAAVKSKPRIAEEHEQRQQPDRGGRGGQRSGHRAAIPGLHGGAALEAHSLFPRAAAAGGGRGLGRSRADRRRRTVFAMRQGDCFEERQLNHG